MAIGGSFMPHMQYHDSSSWISFTREEVRKAGKVKDRAGGACRDSSGKYEDTVMHVCYNEHIGAGLKTPYFDTRLTSTGVTTRPWLSYPFSSTDGIPHLPHTVPTATPHSTN
ncbi:hypothetical protein BDR07DRAFT_1496660 [Suillus spraguei]|nr:hypothetical protein BDR07DRAFT_1496660 [Suillus spraguei]